MRVATLPGPFLEPKGPSCFSCDTANTFVQPRLSAVSPAPSEVLLTDQCVLSIEPGLGAPFDTPPSAAPPGLPSLVSPLALGFLHQLACLGQNCDPKFTSCSPDPQTSSITAFGGGVSKEVMRVNWDPRVGPLPV